MAKTIELSRILTALDKKDRNFYDSLDDEEKKSFSPYLILKYASAIQGNADFYEYYLHATNMRVNKNFFEVQKDKKFAWLLLTTVSPGLGVQRHEWVNTKKKEGSDNKVVKFLRNIYPDAKESDIQTLKQILKRSDLDDLARQHGLNDSEIKSLF
jgi:hypothetical protein